MSLSTTSAADGNTHEAKECASESSMGSVCLSVSYPAVRRSESSGGGDTVELGEEEAEVDE